MLATQQAWDGASTEIGRQLAAPLQPPARHVLAFRHAPRASPALGDEVLQRISGDAVDGGSQGKFAGDDDGEDADPDGDQGDDDEGGRGHGAHAVAPHPRAVHELHGEGQLALEKRAALWVKDDLEVALRMPAVGVGAAQAAGGAQRHKVLYAACRDAHTLHEG